MTVLFILTHAQKERENEHACYQMEQRSGFVLWGHDDLP